jgi:hypothetical protein
MSIPSYDNTGKQATTVNLGSQSDDYFPHFLTSDEIAPRLKIDNKH